MLYIVTIILLFLAVDAIECRTPVCRCLIAFFLLFLAVVATTLWKFRGYHI